MINFEFWTFAFKEKREVIGSLVGAPLAHQQDSYKPFRLNAKVLELSIFIERKVKKVLEVKRKEGESFEALMRRFSKKLLQSGRILQAKKVKYYQKPLNKRAQKQRAIRREEIKKKREYLRRIGKLDEYLETNKRIMVKKKK